MALTREVAGALSHAELVDLVVRQSEVIDQLRAIIAEQRVLIAQLEARIRDLEQQLEQRERNDPTQRMPGLKPATPRRRKSGPRQRRAHGFSRRECPMPTEQVVHAVAVCPRCATPLSGGHRALAQGGAGGASRPGAGHPACVRGAPLSPLWATRGAPTGASD